MAAASYPREAADRPPSDPIGRVLHALTRSLALLGGLVLVALTLMTVWSVLGREVQELPLWPAFPPFSWLTVVPGEFELVELAYAGAVFCFLPYCQMARGNVIVDVFTDRLPPRIKAALAMAGDLLYAAIAAAVTWQLAARAAEHWQADWPETTMILHIPVVWGYVPAVLAFALLTAVCCYTAFRCLHRVTDPGGAA